MNVILSIKPEFAFKILSGQKKYEYRKTEFKKPIDKIFLYASSPIKKIIGEIKIDGILEDKPASLWDATQHLSGITKDFFDAYFNDKEKAYALCISSVKRYDKAINPKEKISGFNAPQSFCYTQIHSFEST